MSERTVLVILCSKTGKGHHRVGRVVATAGGYRVDWTATVRAVTGYAPDGVEQSEALRDLAGVGGTAWCRVCRKALMMTGALLEAAVTNGSRSLRLQAMGMYEDPMGVLARQRQQKGYS